MGNSRNLSLVVGTSQDLTRRWLVSTLEDMSCVVQQALCGWDLLRLLTAGGGVDLAICDLRLAGPGGLRTLGLARTMGIEVPFLLLGDPSDFEVRVAAARLGAGLLSPRLTAGELARSVRASCKVARPSCASRNVH